MTKLDILRGYSNIRIRDSWFAMGSNKITADTKIFNKDTLYKIEIPKSKINGFLIFCVKEYIGNAIDWTQAELSDYNFGEITFGNSIISPNFVSLLTKDEFDEIKTIPDPNFIPFKDEFEKTGQVTISEDDYQRCLTVIGGPFITEEELEYTREEILNLAIKPALEVYFHWIPPIFPEEIAATGRVQEVDMPIDAYACVGVSYQQSGGSMTGNLLSPLFYGLEQSLYGGFNYSEMTGTYFGNRSAATQTSSLQNLLTTRANTQALINYSRRVHYEGPYNRTIVSNTGRAVIDETRPKFIKVYSNNTPGMLNIWWARKSLNFNDVDYDDREYVFKYCQANIKELFANLRRQGKSDIPGMVNYNDWLTEAKTTKEEVTNVYREISKASGVMRGSL